MFLEDPFEFPLLAAKGGWGVTSEISPLLAMAYANRGGIPPNRAQTVLPLWPDIVVISRENPDTKKHYILLNLGLAARNPQCSRAALAVLDEHQLRNNGIQRINFP